MKRLFHKRIYSRANGEPNWAVWRWHEIIPLGQTIVYLLRLYLIQTPFGGSKVHWIRMADTDRHMHDHPWWFFSIVLWGGYEEIVPAIRSDGSTTVEHRWISWFNFKRATDAHRITYVKPNTITFVINGPKVRTWGFHTEKGFVPWREYLGV